MSRDVKVVLLGDSNVGKSSIVIRFVEERFRPTENTVGASFMAKEVVQGDKSVRFQIWDTAGQEKYHSLAPMYYRGAAAALVVYDVTKKSSFDKVKSWVKELQSHGPKDIVLCVAGNKCDLPTAREIPTSLGEAYAKEIGALFAETSAKDDTNISSLFLDMLPRVYPLATIAADSKGTFAPGITSDDAPKSGCGC